MYTTAQESYRSCCTLRSTSSRFRCVGKVTAKPISTMTAVGSVKEQLAKLFEESLRATFPDESDVQPMMAICNNPKFGDYQCNNAMSLWAKIKGKGTQFKGPQPVGQAIMNNLPQSDVIEKCSIAGPGFVNVVLSREWIAQGGEEKYRKAWSQICEISRKEFEKVYQRLGVHLEERGESFYNPFIPKTIELLNEKGLVEESEGARVIFIEGKKIPLIVVKRDGGYNYASTDLTAIWYRLNEEKAEWMIYVTDVGQREHFEMVFAAAKLAGWFPSDENAYPKASHVGFGLVLGEDGKRFRTRSTEVVKLIDLLDEAKSRCKTALIERGKAAEWTEEELEQTAEAVGYGAVKYADLKNNRLTNYTFNFDQMLSDKGNTAVYLLYAHARICSIIRKSGKDIEELKKTGTLDLAHQDERTLGLHLLQFPEVVEEACTNLLPNLLCEYLYNLSEDFTGFYTSCQVVGSAQETSRLLLCEATAVVMRKCFHLLGITPVYKI
nr:arginine--tRNA ligase, cytoplasmic-like isoform X1 [Ipomoea trifida]